MSVPLSTTTVTFSRPTPGDPYENATLTVLATGVRAHFSKPTGSEQTVGGQQERVDAVLLCDPVDGVDHYCIAIDEADGATWDVKWVRRRRGLGMDHLQAGVIAVSGASNG